MTDRALFVAVQVKIHLEICTVSVLIPHTKVSFLVLCVGTRRNVATKVTFKSTTVTAKSYGSLGSAAAR